MKSNPVSHRIPRIILAGAIVIAPFLALLVRLEAGLFVMALALFAVSGLLREALAAAPLRSHRWLRAAIVLDVILATACLALAVARLRNG